MKNHKKKLVMMVEAFIDHQKVGVADIAKNSYNNFSYSKITISVLS